MSTTKQAHGLQRIPHEVVPKLKALYAAGVSYQKIANAIGVSFATAHRAINGVGAYAEPDASA
jgi:hypothetical protein